MTISKAQARRIALNAQLLDGRTKFPRGKEGIAKVIETLGYIQIDTISVVERAHHHTLWNRRPDYTEKALDTLQSRERRIFEYWGHAASYLPMHDYRYYIKRMKAFHDPHEKWEKQRFEKYGHLMPQVKERIVNEGPLGSKDFNPPENNKKGTWWDWRPAKVALEMLYWRGELMITGRRNFHRLYDLTERVLPDWVDTTEPSDEEQGQFLVRRALNAYGIATDTEIKNHLFGFNKKSYDDAIATMADSGEILPVQIAGEKNGKQYILADRLEALTKLRRKKPQLSILSPFDNLIIQRDRTKRLFDFEYTIECYVPAPKRVYGYFVLPILWGESLIGRMDAKADRKANRLIIRKFYLEETFTSTDDFWDALSATLKDYCSFNGCETLKVESTQPSSLKRSIASIISK
ncbi:MAG: crosslink repair DNA glycosylase YcaQ family protein [Candidatus Zixiibacteriota bacterium]